MSSEITKRNRSKKQLEIEHIPESRWVSKPLIQLEQALGKTNIDIMSSEKSKKQTKEKNKI